MSYNYISKDKKVIALIKKAGLWGRFLGAMREKTLRSRNFFFVMVDKNLKRGKANYYLFFDGHEDPEDNGYSAIIFDDTRLNLVESLRQIVEVEDFLRKNFIVAPEIVNVSNDERMH